MVVFGVCVLCVGGLAGESSRVVMRLGLLSGVGRRPAVVGVEGSGDPSTTGVYGLLHHPGYRTKYADNLKRELPRIPFAPDFRAFSKAGEKLAKLHLDYEKLKPWDLEFVETPGVPLSYRVEDKMRLSKDKLRLAVNRSLTVAGIPPEAFEYRLGNRSAVE